MARSQRDTRLLFFTENEEGQLTVYGAYKPNLFKSWGVKINNRAFTQGQTDGAF